MMLRDETMTHKVVGSQAHRGSVQLQLPTVGRRTYSQHCMHIPETEMQLGEPSTSVYTICTQDVVLHGDSLLAMSGAA